MTKYLSVFTNKRMLISLLLGFSSGLPLALTGSTVQAWLSDAKIDIATIGLFALVGLPYTMKFVWAPLLDNCPLPFLGLRRGWMVVCQIGLFGATLGLGSVNPANALSLFSCLALLLAFFSASQDIVVDAYRTEIIKEQNELGAGASTYITGYRIATLISGGVALGMADHYSWKFVYFSMAVVNLVGMVTILLSPEPKVTRKLQVKGFRDSVTLPFLEFFQRSGAMEILIFIMVYKLSTLMATALTTKFLLDLGYTKLMIGAVNKGAGLIASISGTLVGGSLMLKLGLKKSLWIFGVIQALVGVTFCLLAMFSGHESHIKDLALVVIVSLDQFMMGLGTAALTGFMMSVCSRQFTGTQYALLTSIMAVARVILIAHAGTLVAMMGWNWFFIATVPLAIPGLLLLNRYDQWGAHDSAANVGKKIPTFDKVLIPLFLLGLFGLSSTPLWNWMGLKDLGTEVTLAGAVCIVIVVFVGLARPYFSKAAR